MLHLGPILPELLVRYGRWIPSDFFEPVQLGCQTTDLSVKNVYLLLLVYSGLSCLLVCLSASINLICTGHQLFAPPLYGGRMNPMFGDNVSRCRSSLNASRTIFSSGEIVFFAMDMLLPISSYSRWCSLSCQKPCLTSWVHYKDLICSLSKLCPDKHEPEELNSRHN